MTDTFELADNNGVRRFGGTAYAPGATPGDVFTVQTDGSLLPEPGGGSQAVVVVNVPISSAQLLAINPAGQIQLVAAPGANKIVRPLSATFKYLGGVTPYNTSPTFRIGPGANGAGDVNTRLMFASGTGIDSTDVAYTPFDLVTGNGGIPDSDIANLALFLASNQTLTDGTGGAVVSVAYYIADLS